MAIIDDYDEKDIEILFNVQLRESKIMGINMENYSLLSATKQTIKNLLLISEKHMMLRSTEQILRSTEQNVISERKHL